MQERKAERGGNRFEIFWAMSRNRPKLSPEFS